MSAEGGDIQSLYMDDGYLFFRVDPVETAVYNDTINFEIRMQEGPQATIGKVDNQLEMIKQKTMWSDVN